MNRDEKAATIEEIAAQIEAAEAIFAVDYRGISVPQASELRGRLRESDASFRIVKNRLTRLAAEKAGEDRLASLLEGPTALTFVRGDTAAAAKAITTFNKEHEVLAYKGGFMDGTDLDEDRFKSIARLPARDVLNGQFAGVIASPLTGLVRGLGSMIQGLALQLGQIAEQGLVTGEAPAEAPASDEESSSSQAGEETAGSDSSGSHSRGVPAEPDPAVPSSGDEAPPDAAAAGGAAGGTAPEEASATGGGGGSPAATGPAAEEADEETSETENEEEQE